jgi:hypothetical protein
VGGGISWEGSNVTSINADIDDNMGFLSVLKTYIDLTLGGVQPYIGLDFSSQINRPDIGSDANDYQESLILYGGVSDPRSLPFSDPLLGLCLRQPLHPGRTLRSVGVRSQGYHPIGSGACPKG